MKQFCKRGHDTFATGRRTNGACRACGNLQARTWYQNNTEQARAQSTAWAKANPAARRRIVRKSRGIVGLPDVEAKTGDPCHVCGRPIVGTPNADHDHQTGQFRGWTCMRCNLRLEARDDALWMKQADDYLDRHRAIS